MSTPENLPPNPPGIRPLTDEEGRVLREQFPGLWVNPSKSCITCSKVDGPVASFDGTFFHCDCISQWVLHRYLLHSGVLLHYQRLSWSDITDQIPAAALEAVLDYIENSTRYANAGVGLILRGPSGTGKTLMLSLILKALLGRGIDGYFAQFNDILDGYSAGWRDAEAKRWFARRVRNTKVLVIDDLGKESKGRENVSNSMLDQIVRSRVSSSLPTLITTNYTVEEMQSGYGSAVMSLLSERSIVVEVTGTDFRKQSLERNLHEVRTGLVRPITLG